MQTLSEITQLLGAHGLRPKHRLGQNFLHDHNQLKKLVAAASVQPGSLVLEVGPGTGTLTETLLEAGARVIACELDADMVAIVGGRNSARMCAGADAAALGPGQLHLIHADCLDSKHALSARVVEALRAVVPVVPAVPAVPGTPVPGAPVPGTPVPFTLVSNLPYQAATPLMATLLEQHPECTGQFVTIQREVADRLMAKPSTAAYGPLSVTMQLLARVELIGVVPPGCFWPAPTVTSAMIAIHPHQARPIDPWDPFAKFVQKAFGQRRKQLGSTLGRERIAAAGFDPQRRPETLSPNEWVELFQKTVS